MIAILPSGKTGAAIAEGLAAAQGTGIVHRDLKPDNYFDHTLAVSPDSDFTYQRRAWNFRLWRGDLAAARQTLERYPGTSSDLMGWAWFWQEVYEGKADLAIERLDQAQLPTATPSAT